jgi:hypothetical protein
MTDNKSGYCVLVCDVCGHEHAMYDISRPWSAYRCMLCSATMSRSEPLSWALEFSIKHELSTEADHELAERMRHA